MSNSVLDDAIDELCLINGVEPTQLRTNPYQPYERMVQVIAHLVAATAMDSDLRNAIIQLADTTE